MFSTWTSQVVPHLSTNRACPCLTSQIERDAVLSRKYGRTYQYQATCLYIKRPLIGVINKSSCCFAVVIHNKNKKGLRTGIRTGVVLIIIIIIKIIVLAVIGANNNKKKKKKKKKKKNIYIYIYIYIIHM